MADLPRQHWETGYFAPRGPSGLAAAAPLLLAAGAYAAQRVALVACVLAILGQLWVRMPQPTQRPSPPLLAVAAAGEAVVHFRIWIRPSAPARKRNPRRNQRWRSCCCRSREARPTFGRTIRLTPRARERSSFSGDADPRSRRPGRRMPKRSW